MGCYSLLQEIVPTQGSNHISFVSCFGRLGFLPLAPPAEPSRRQPWPVKLLLRSHLLKSVSQNKSYGQAPSPSPGNIQEEESQYWRGVEFITSIKKVIAVLGRLFYVTWLRKTSLGTSLVVQWLRICLAIQQTQVRPLVEELRSYMPSDDQAHVPHLEKPMCCSY